MKEEFPRGEESPEETGPELEALDEETLEHIREQAGFTTEEDELLGKLAYEVDPDAVEEILETDSKLENPSEEEIEKARGGSINTKFKEMLDRFPKLKRGLHAAVLTSTLATGMVAAGAAKPEVVEAQVYGEMGKYRRGGDYGLASRRAAEGMATREIEYAVDRAQFEIQVKMQRAALEREIEASWEELAAARGQFTEEEYEQRVRSLHAYNHHRRQQFEHDVEVARAEMSARNRYRRGRDAATSGGIIIGGVIREGIGRIFGGR